MATLEIKDSKGKAVGKVEVSKLIGSAEPAMSVLHRAVVAEEANTRQGTQKTKTRSEVRGGGRKPYKQKKTGNARQGTIRAPHYAHGGMALAITPRAYTKKLNKKERRGALLGALNAQIEAGNVIVTDKISFDRPSTKGATALLKTLGAGDVNRVLVILAAYDEMAYKSLRNIPGVVIRTAPAKQVAAPPAEEKKSKKSAPEQVKSVAFSTRDILVAKKVIVVADAFKAMEEVWA